MEYAFQTDFDEKMLLEIDIFFRRSYSYLLASEIELDVIHDHTIDKPSTYRWNFNLHNQRKSFLAEVEVLYTVQRKIYSKSDDCFCLELANIRLYADIYDYDRYFSSYKKLDLYAQVVQENLKLTNRRFRSMANYLIDTLEEE
jgi:hypothetical protein